MIEKEFENIHETREKVHDAMDLMPAQKIQMAQRLKKRAIELGITKDQFDKGFIDLNIMDMYKLNYRDACKTCFLNKKCPKHGIQKMGRREKKPYGEREIYYVFNPVKKGQFS